LDIIETSAQVINGSILEGFQFESIHIRRNAKLRQFDPQSLVPSKEFLKHFFLITCRNVEKSIFDTLSTLPALEWLWIHHTNLEEVPDMAFGNPEYGVINQPNLTWIYISCNKVKYIGSKAFSNLPSVAHLDLHNNKIEHIGNEAFIFDQMCDGPKLALSIGHNRLTSSSISKTAFTKICRQTYLKLNLNNLTYLDEDTFKPFLVKSHPENTLLVSDNPIICNECKLKWTTRIQNFATKYLKNRIRCGDGRFFEKYNYNDYRNCDVDPEYGRWGRK